MAHTKLFLLFLLAVLVHSQAYVDSQLKETKMTLYLQDYVAPSPNATGLILTGIPGRAWSYNSFGTVYVTDDLMTEGRHKNSRKVARAQGLTVTCSLDGANGFNLFSILFTNKKYKGSTLQIQGVNVQLASGVENAVVGGTGKFKFARGFITMTTILADVATGYTVLQVNITVLHY